MKKITLILVSFFLFSTNVLPQKPSRWPSEYFGWYKSKDTTGLDCPIKEVLFPDQETNNIGLIDSAGDTLLERYAYFIPQMEFGMCPVWKSYRPNDKNSWHNKTRIGLVDKKGKIILKPIYNYMWILSSKRVLVRKGILIYLIHLNKS